MTDDDRGDPCADLDFAGLVDPSLATKSDPLPPMSDRVRETFEALARGGDVLAEAIEREVFEPFARAHGLPVPTVRFADDPIVAMAIAENESAAPSAPTVPHASYLGASDIGAILGLDPMRTALDVWCEKTGRVVFESTPELEAGNDHEAAVVAGFRRRMLRAKLVERVEYPGPGTILGREMDAGDGPLIVPPRLVQRARFLLGQWRGATLDAVAWHVEHGPCPLEAKLVGAGMADAWGPEPAAAEGIPLRTYVQVHWQTAHARERFGWRAPVAFVAADIAGTDRRAYEIPIDDALIERLIEAGREWWSRHVLGDEMPEPVGRDVETLSHVFPHVRRPLSPIPPSGLRELAEDYDVAREIAARHRDELRRIGAKLRALLGDAEGYKWPGGRVTWREDAAGDRRLHVRIWRNDE